jgi:hypothetical protein
MTAARPLGLDDFDVRPLDLDSFSPEERAEIEEDLAALAVGHLETVPGDQVTKAIAADDIKARMRELGVSEECVEASDDPAKMRAWLDKACAPAS